ncbi:MAG: site-2 protease family protein [Vulcanimicrobiaceae bacterium]
MDDQQRPILPVRVPPNPYTSSWSAERPAPEEAQTQQPAVAPPEHKSKKKGLGAIAVAAAALFAKFKALLFLLLNLKWFVIGLKVFWFAGSFLLSLWFYALFFGWTFGLIFLLLIAVHEFGHWFAMRYYGVPSSLPFFIPGMGALVNMRGRPASAFHESLIAFAGPLTGTVASAVCAWIGFQTGQPFWLAAAYLGFFLNLFNLAPVMPLDGGRVVGSISPRIWIAGLALFLVAIFVFRIFNPLIWILVLLSLPQVWAAWKGRLDPRYYDIPIGQRIGVTALYFGLAALLFAGMLLTHVPVAGHPIAQ